MPMKFNGKRILRIISLRWAQRISVINGKESALICEKRERWFLADIRRLNPQMDEEKKRVLLFKILLKVKNHLSDLFRNYFGTLYLKICWYNLLQIGRCYAPEINIRMWIMCPWNSMGGYFKKDDWRIELRSSDNICRKRKCNNTNPELQRSVI